jgi:hypothetical protein
LFAFCASAARADFTYTLPPPAWSNVMRDVHMNPMKYQSVTRPGTQQRDTTRSIAPGQGNRQGVASVALTSTVVVAPEQATMPAKIAANYPSHSRPEAERVFRELLAKYPQLMRQLGVPANDMGSAVAAFLAGSYMAYKGIDLPDEHFKPLANQMRQMIGGNPDFAKASDAEKQEMHEQMAILGTFMAVTQTALKEKPNPQIAANLKQAAKGYLEEFLKTDAERVQITAQGLVLK